MLMLALGCGQAMHLNQECGLVEDTDNIRDNGAREGRANDSRSWFAWMKGGVWYTYVNILDGRVDSE